jgi:hypothetical protein
MAVTASLNDAEGSILLICHVDGVEAVEEELTQVGRAARKRSRVLE